MVKTALVFVLSVFSAACENPTEMAFSKSQKTANVYENGDLVFQVSRSGQSRAIQLATGSKYSHCGILFEKNGKWSVLEAVQPVKITPIETWIKRGTNRHFVVKRLKKKALLNPANLQKMETCGKNFLGKNYDLVFGWSDEKIYCSELIWKIYKTGAEIELCPLQKLRDFDLSHPIVKKKMAERYGKNIPLDEPVVPPSALFGSEMLETVLLN